MQVVNEYQKNTRWDVKKNLSDELSLKIAFSNNILPSLKRLDGPPHLNTYSCKLNWHYTIISTTDNETLFDFEYVEINRIVCKKGVYEPDKIRTMLLFSNMQFIGIFDTKKSNSLLHKIEIPQFTDYQLDQIEKEIRAIINLIEYTPILNLRILGNTG